MAWERVRGSRSVHPFRRMGRGRVVCGRRRDRSRVHSHRGRWVGGCHETEALRANRGCAGCGDSLFDDAADDTESAAADEQDANEETEQEPQGACDTEEQAGAPEVLRDVVSIRAAGPPSGCNGPRRTRTSNRSTTRTVGRQRQWDTRRGRKTREMWGEVSSLDEVEYFR